MRKADEIKTPTSCFNKAKDDEMLFVLLGRDPASAATVRFWASQRVTLGKNVFGDEQISEALKTAMTMSSECPIKFRAELTPSKTPSKALRNLLHCFLGGIAVTSMLAMLLAGSKTELIAESVTFMTLCFYLLNVAFDKS